MNYIIKRDGRKEIFDKTKILLLLKASEALGPILHKPEKCENNYRESIG